MRLTTSSDSASKMARLGAGVRRFLDGVPRWLAVWTDAHLRYPGWLPGSVFAGVTYLIVVAYGVVAGDLRQALTDWNLVGTCICVLIGSLAVVYLPRMAARVETSLKSWVTDGAEFLAPRRLTQLFWPCFCLRSSCLRSM